MKTFGSTWPILKNWCIWNQEKKFYKHTKVHKNLRGWVAILKFSGSGDVKCPCRILGECKCR